MITQNNIKDLKTIVSNLAYEDYLKAYKKSARYLKGRYTPGGKERKFKGYTLSSETLEAREILLLATKKNITGEEEEKIKSFLLNVKLIKSHLLIKSHI